MRIDGERNRKEERRSSIPSRRPIIGSVSSFEHCWITGNSCVERRWRYRIDRKTEQAAVAHSRHAQVPTIATIRTLVDIAAAEGIGGCVDRRRRRRIDNDENHIFTIIQTVILCGPRSTAIRAFEETTGRAGAALAPIIFNRSTAPSRTSDSLRGFSSVRTASAGVRNRT